MKNEREVHARMKKIYRQGDILLEKIEKLPSNLKEKDNIIAVGEATGHSHRLIGNVQVLIDRKGNQFANVKEKSVLSHEEHSKLQIPKGKYKIVQQREFDILHDQVRQVSD